MKRTIKIAAARLRGFGAAMAVVTMLGAAAPAIVENETVAVPQLASGTNTRTVSFTKVGSKLAKDQLVGPLRGGLLCMSWQKIIFSQKHLTALETLFPQILYAEAASIGFKTSGGSGNLFSEQTAAPELLIGASVEAETFDGCMPGVEEGDTVSTRGRAALTVEWQIYSTVEKRVIAKVTTSGAYYVPKSSQGTVPTIVSGAIRISARKFIASPEFRTAFVGVERVGSPIAQAGNRPAPLTYSNTNKGPSAVSDAVGGVVALFNESGMGSGFLIGSEGLLLTNHHVVGTSKYLKVRWPDGFETIGEVLRSDAKRDVALVKTDPRGRLPLKLASGSPAPGDDLYAVGTPLDAAFQSSVTKGVMSASRVIDGLSYIQSDVTVNPGNSGGPLLDKNADVVAITVWGFQPEGQPTGINLFIPLRDALDFLSLKQN